MTGQERKAINVSSWHWEAWSPLGAILVGIPEGMSGKGRDAQLRSYGMGEV